MVRNRCGGLSLSVTDNNVPFFIVGAGRSGTTLLRLILNGHSHIQIPPETWFIQPLVAAVPVTGILSVEEIETAISIITNHRRWDDMDFDSAEFGAAARSIPNARLEDVLELIYRRHLAKHGKKRFGDKTPMYIDIMPELKRIYPGARFIHLIRDGRDVAISQLDVGWRRYHERNFPWTTTMATRRNYLKSELAKDILEVRYESLVTDLEGTVRQICDFLGETFEPNMLSWNDRTEQVPERERPIHKKLAARLSDSSVGVWKAKLAPLECFLMEACLHDELLELGYKLKFSGSVWRPLLKISRAVLHQLSPWLQRGIPYLQRRKLLHKQIYI